MLLVAMSLVVVGCSGEPTATTPVSTATSAPAPTTVAPTTTVATGLVDPLPVLAVGDGGVEYRGGGEELELSGPTTVAVGSDGVVYIVDPIANQILSFGPTGSSEIDLASIDVLSAPWIAVASDHLVVVEIFFSPLRERVHRIGFDGRLISSFQLPIGGRLETGLSGVMVDEPDRIHLVIAGGADYLQLTDETLGFTSVGSITKNGVTVSQAGIGVRIGEVEIGPELVGELGGLTAVDVAADGTVVVLREDVVSLDPFTVNQSVEWYDSDGGFIGSAPVDLAAQAISTPPGIAVGPDGRVVAMYALTDRVEVVELLPLAERVGT